MQAAKRGRRRSSQRCKTKQRSSYLPAVPGEDQHQASALQLPENDTGKEPWFFHGDAEHPSASLIPSASSSSCGSWPAGGPDFDKDGKQSASSSSYGSLPSVGPEALSNTPAGFYSPEQVRFAQQREDSLLTTPVDISSAFVVTSSKVFVSDDLERSLVRTVDTLLAPSPQLGLWETGEVEAIELGMADIKGVFSPVSNEKNNADASSISQSSAESGFSLTRGSMKGMLASEPTMHAPLSESSSCDFSSSTSNTGESVAQFDIVSGHGLKSKARQRKTGRPFSFAEMRNFANKRKGQRSVENRWKVAGGVDNIAGAASEKADSAHSEGCSSSFVQNEREVNVIQDHRPDEHAASDNFCPSEANLSALPNPGSEHMELLTEGKEHAVREPRLESVDWEDRAVCAKEMDAIANCASQTSAATHPTSNGLSSTVDEAASLQSASSVLPPLGKLTMTIPGNKPKADKTKKRRRQSAFGAELNLNILEMVAENKAVSGSGSGHSFDGDGMVVEKGRTEQEGGGVVTTTTTTTTTSMEKTNDLTNSCQDPSQQLSASVCSCQASESAVPDSTGWTTLDEVPDLTGLDEQQRAEAQDILDHLQLDPEPRPKKKRKRRVSADLAILMESEQSSLTQPQDDQQGQSQSDDRIQTGRGRRSSLRLYRRQSLKFAVTSSAGENEVLEQNSEQTLSSCTAEVGGSSVSSASHVDAKSKNEAEWSESAEVIPTELENLYRNKNYQAPAGKVWETIFEVPSKGKMTSKQKLKRYVQFEDNVPMPKLRRRLKRAAENGWDADIRYSQSQFTDFDVKLKLQKLDEEID